MARDLPSNYAQQLGQRVLAPAFFVHLDWPSGPVYAWGGYGEVTWGGRAWQGVGELGSISPIGESSEGRANGVQLTLSGIPNAQIARAFDNKFQGSPAQIYLGLFNEQMQLISAPLCLFDGVIDSSGFEDTGETSTITVNLEKELIDRRDDMRRFTHEDQQLEAPGDKFFEQVAWLSQNQITFGPRKAGFAVPPNRFANGN